MSDDKPVTVRLYGCLPMTRRRYVFQLIFAGALAAMLLLAWFLRWPPLRAEMVKAGLANTRMVWWLDLAPWVILFAAVLQSFEAWIVLRQFADKEKETPPGP